MNNLTNNFKDIKKGLSIDVALDANLTAQNVVLEVKSKTRESIHLKHVYARSVEYVMANPRLVKAIVESFTKPKQVA